MISRKTGLAIVGSALLLAACHKTDTTADTNDTSNMAAIEDIGNDSDAANTTDEMDNGDRYNPDTRGKPASGTQ